MDSTKHTCPDFGLSNRTDDDCHITVNYVLAKHKITSNPGLEKQILQKNASKMYKRRSFSGIRGPKPGRKHNNHAKGVKMIINEDMDESVFPDDDVDDVGSIDMGVGLDSDADFEGLLCVETELPDVVVSEFSSDVQLN